MSILGCFLAKALKNLFIVGRVDPIAFISTLLLLAVMMLVGIVNQREHRKVLIDSHLQHNVLLTDMVCIMRSFKEERFCSEQVRIFFADREALVFDLSTYVLQSVIYVFLLQ